MMPNEPITNGASTGGTSLVAVPSLPLPASKVVQWQEGAPAPPEILTAGMDPIWLWHSLRRRWLLAVSLGLGVSLFIMLMAWALIPATSQAMAVLKVDSVKPIVFRRVDEGESDYETYRRTLAGMFKTEPVLKAALRLDGGALTKLPTLQNIPAEQQTGTDAGFHVWQ